MSFARSEAEAHRIYAAHSGATAPRKSRWSNARKLSWPMERFAEGLDELSRRAGLVHRPAGPITLPQKVLQQGGAEFDRWLTWAGAQLGVQADPIVADAPDLTSVLTGAPPAILRFTDAEGPRFLLLLGLRFGRARVIAPDLRVRSCDLAELQTLVVAPFEPRAARDIDKVLDLARPGAKARSRMRDFLLADRLKDTEISGLILLRRPAGASFMRQVIGARILPRIAGVMAIFAMVYALEIVGWMLIGEGVMNGRVDFGWLLAWSMLILSMIPLRYLGGCMNATAAVRLGALLKARLLAGSLRLDPDEVRRQGAGRMLAAVMEAQAFENIAISGGLGMLVSGIELAFAFWLLSLSPSGFLQPLLLAGWIAVSAGLGYRFYAAFGSWTAARVEMTNALVERMIGHRTVLAQGQHNRRHVREDVSLKDYGAVSRRFDAAVAAFVVIVPMGWSILGLAGLAPAFINGAASPLALAAGAGGVMFAARALTGLSSGAVALARAAIAWRSIAPLFNAAKDDGRNRPFIHAEKTHDEPGGRHTALLEAHDVSFRFDHRSRPVLDGVNVRIARGDRILLQGASGGGKSTLTALLTGLREPEAGLLLVNGLDRHSIGDAWGEFATQAPQFHDNHILAGPLAFNLLMGRNWPPSSEELEQAREVCEELGLGDLLERMPAGLMQPVGETGWVLSHGERSRVFLARAILQEAPLTILDESFAALDPQTLQRCVECAFRRTRTLIVVAHP